MSDETEKTGGEGLAALRDRQYGKIEYLDSQGVLRVTRGSGDAVALAMIGLDEAGVAEVAKDNELPVKARGAYINYGQFRMAVGNSARAKVKAGESVQINGLTVKKLDQKVVNPAIKAAVEFRKQRDKEAAAADKTKKAAA